MKLNTNIILGIVPCKNKKNNIFIVFFIAVFLSNIIEVAFFMVSLQTQHMVHNHPAIAALLIR
jgi:hypothetical protein